jgi:glutamate/aspartate transport system permease protein
MSLLFEPTPDGAGRYYDWILSGLGWTLSLALGAWTVALVVGTLVGVARTLPRGILPKLGRVYVETFRNVPLLVQMFFWYFVLPELLPARIGQAIKQMEPPWASFVPALICLGLFTAARIAEQVRARRCRRARCRPPSRSASVAPACIAWSCCRRRSGSFCRR